MRNKNFLNRKVVQHMKVIWASDYQEVSKRTADYIKAQILMKPNCVLGLATGSSPIGTYQNLVSAYQNGEVDFSKVTSVNLDEYFGLDGEHDQSYRYFMNHHLFDHVNIAKENTFVPSGITEDIEQETQRYEQLIRDLGGVDLQLLGIGHNGHIGFNEPCNEFVPQTHAVDLGESTIQANARFFGSIENVPKKAITMGIGTIMSAKKIILIASGKDKKEIIHRSIYGAVTPDVPASILQLHPDVTVIAAVD